MPIFSNAQRLKIALGGLASFVGLLILVCAILTLTGLTNLALVFQGWTGVAIASSVAALDLACGLFLARGKKEIVLSLASDQEKTHC